MWLARDFDGDLKLFWNKPTKVPNIRNGIFTNGKDIYDEPKDENIFENCIRTKDGELFIKYKGFVSLKPTCYPEIQWENSPVELVLKFDKND